MSVVHPGESHSARTKPKLDIDAVFDCNSRVNQCSDMKQKAIPLARVALLLPIWKSRVSPSIKARQTQIHQRHATFSLAISAKRFLPRLLQHGINIVIADRRNNYRGRQLPNRRFLFNFTGSVGHFVRTFSTTTKLRIFMNSLGSQQFRVEDEEKPVENLVVFSSYTSLSNPDFEVTYNRRTRRVNVLVY